MNSTSADPPGGLQPFRPTGKLRHERPQCRLKVLQDRPAETVDRLRPHSRVGLDARDSLVLGDIREGDAAALLAAADPVRPSSVDQPADRTPGWEGKGRAVS